MRWALRCCHAAAILLHAHALGIVAPQAALDAAAMRADSEDPMQLAFAHDIACIGRRFRPLAPYEKPITTTPQLARSWPEWYTSLHSIQRACTPTSNSSACQSYPGRGFTVGRLMLASPRTPPLSSDGLETAFGCTPIDRNHKAYGGYSMEGSICLVQRGGCPFHIKWQNCANAGASAVIIFGTPGGSRFMVGPDETYRDSGPGLLTVGYNLYATVAPYLPEAIVAMEQVVATPVANCTHEAFQKVNTSKYSREKATAMVGKEIAECESKLAAAQAAAALEGLYSGNMMAAHMTEMPDDPYTDCILESPCAENFTELRVYLITVIAMTTVLLLSFCQIFSMFWQGHSKSPMKPRDPRWVSTADDPGSGCLRHCKLSPHYQCKCVVCPIFPVFYKKPGEYINTGVFRFFLYTWAFFPRASDPQMTFVARILCTVVCTLGPPPTLFSFPHACHAACVAFWLPVSADRSHCRTAAALTLCGPHTIYTVGLICMMVLGNSGVKYKGMRGGSDVEVAGEAYEQGMAELNSAIDHRWITLFHMFVCVTLQEIAKQLIRRWMGRLHELTSGERTKQADTLPLAPCPLT